MLLGVAISCVFGIVYVSRRPPVWISFWLQQIEGGVFLASIPVLLVVPKRARIPVVCGVLVISTFLIMPATVYGGENPTNFMKLLPLLMAITFPNEPWLAVASGLSALGAIAWAIVSFHIPVNPVYELSSTTVIVLATIYGFRRFRRIHAALNEASERDMTRVTQALSAAASRLYALRSEQEVLQGAVGALAQEGLDAQVLTLKDGGYRREVPGFEAEALLVPERAPHLNEAMQSRRAVFHDGENDWPEIIWPKHTATAALDAPIFVEGKPLGCLCVRSQTLRPSSAAMIELFASHVGAAIENVRHHQRGVERLEQLTRLQAELVARERLAALGEAAAVVAHEVRNPLGAIVNAAALLKRDGTTPSADFQPERLLSMIEEEAMRLDEMVHDLLVLARPLAPAQKSVNLAELVQRATALMGDPSFSRRIEVKQDSPDAAVALGDPDHLQLVFLNLLRNAFQASPPNAPVRIRFRTAYGQHVISVEDEGPGIAPELREKIFEPFFTTRPTGTGLGLAIVKRVVEAHRGTIQVLAGSGTGTRFEVGLPSA